MSDAAVFTGAELWPALRQSYLDPIRLEKMFPSSLWVLSWASVRGAPVTVGCFLWRKAAEKRGTPNYVEAARCSGEEPFMSGVTDDI